MIPTGNKAQPQSAVTCSELTIEATERRLASCNCRLGDFPLVNHSAKTISQHQQQHSFRYY